VQAAIAADGIDGAERHPSAHRRRVGDSGQRTNEADSLRDTDFRHHVSDADEVDDFGPAGAVLARSRQRLGTAAAL
jgi:hypothetical protein